MPLTLYVNITRACTASVLARLSFTLALPHDVLEALLVVALQQYRT
jgi:hypothetical protein